MRLSDFCNRLTTTCTQHGPSDSRARLGSPRMSLAGSSLGLPCGRASATPRGVASAAGAGLPSVLGPPASPRVERRLTATLQLPPSSTTMPGACPGPRPRARVEAGTARSWWSCDRQLLRAVRRAAALSAANQARDVASDALCRSPPPRPAFPREERTAPTVPPGPPSPPSRQRQRLPPDQGAFRRRDLLRSACSTLARSADLRLMGSPALPDGIAAARTRGLAAACMRPLSTGPATSPRSGALARAETHGRLKRATTLLHPFARGKSPSANAEPRRKVALPCVGRGG